MAEVEMDNATRFIVSAGCIDCNNSTDETKAAYLNQIDTFLEALRTAAGISDTVSRPSVRPQIDEVLFNLKLTPSMYDMYLQLVNQANGNFFPKLVFKLINNSSVSLNAVFPPADAEHPYFLYWAIYKSKAVSLSENSSAYDVGVTLAYEKMSEFSARGIPGPRYGDSLIPEILNGLAINSAFNFCLVTVVDSIYEGETPNGYRGIILPNLQVSWGDDQESDIGKVFNTHSDVPSHFVPEGSEQQVSRDITSSLLITSDCSLYPATEGTKKNGSFGSICPSIYLTPAWSPSSRCISINTKTLQWGGQLDGNGDYPSHYGPEYIQIGSNYYLKCIDMYMPVTELTTS